MTAMEEVTNWLCRAWAVAEPIIHDYQTLIAGFAAIFAAWMAARPVWRQLRAMDVQTRAMSMQTSMVLRAFLIDQIDITRRRREWFAGRLDQFGSDTTSQIYRWGEPVTTELSPEWANEHEQEAESLLKNITRFKGDRHDPPEIEHSIDEVLTRLMAVRDALDDIHRPYSMDQHDVDHAFTDEQWAALGRKGAKSEEDIGALTTDFIDASGKLDMLFETEINRLLARVGQVDRVTLAGDIR
jgi:hypothetical protein